MTTSEIPSTDEPYLYAVPEDSRTLYWDAYLAALRRIHGLADAPPTLLDRKASTDKFRILERYDILTSGDVPYANEVLAVLIVSSSIDLSA
jgi:hypothetical protein